MPALALDSIRKRYRDTLVLPGLSLRVEPGECVAVVGPSGCGKTTLLRVIAGLEASDGGRVEIGGRDVTTAAPDRRDVAMVFQGAPLYPHMDVRGNLAFPLRSGRFPLRSGRFPLRSGGLPLRTRGARRDEIERRVGAVAALLEISGLLGRRPHELSGGERQRVAIGRAIVRAPRVFLFDEPFGSLDAQLRHRLRGELKRLLQRLHDPKQLWPDGSSDAAASSPPASIVVTHDHEEAMALGDRIVVVDRGVVMQDGPPEAIHRRPANRFVATFMGTPAMNLLPATLDGDGSVRVAGSGGMNSVRIDAFRDAAMRGVVEAGGAFILGVRPQHLHRVSASVRTGLRIELVVEVVEYLGDWVDVHGRVGDVATPSSVIARLPTSSRIVPGDRVELVAGIEDLHFFSDEGEALL